jgi:hypothetical protein
MIPFSPYASRRGIIRLVFIYFLISLFRLFYLRIIFLPRQEHAHQPPLHAPVRAGAQAVNAAVNAVSEWQGSGVGDGTSASTEAGN